MKKEEFKKRFKELSGLREGKMPYQIVKEYIKRAEKSKGRYRGKIYPVILVRNYTMVYLVDYYIPIRSSLKKMGIKYETVFFKKDSKNIKDFIKILTYID
jgi:hypothetical protein